jgi:hypothetical protein
VAYLNWAHIYIYIYIYNIFDVFFRIEMWLFIYLFLSFIISRFF